ncbi:MAG TPA: SRPBCC family protein [Nitrososphaerales archaeon]|nr:SRPBCC family protein [Nitrososphaerales archaeon]
MPKIDHSIEINASRDRLWEIISDVDNECVYWWGTKAIKNISKDGEVIIRDITQNFGNRKIRQRVILHPKDSVEIQYVKGITEGVKLLSIESVGENKQNLRAYWDVTFSGVLKVATPIIKSHVEKGTLGALQRIKEAAEKKGGGEDNRIDSATSATSASFSSLAA